MRSSSATTAGVVALVLLAGCGAASTTGSPTSSTQPSSSSTKGTRGEPDPVQACVRQVTYWVGETLRAAPDQGFDYQHMGLSGATYEVVRDLVDEARERGGPDAATAGLVAGRAEEECRALKGSDATGTADPGVGGWP